MDLSNAIAAHMDWKTKLRAAINEQQQLDAATIGRDNCCELGKWLHGQGKLTVGAKAEYATLVARHRDFHAEAGKVAALINARRYTDAETALGAGSKYSQSSNAVGVAINALKKCGH